MKKRVIVLTGAGISAESGLKTFRDSDGLWMGYNIEEVATPRAFQKDPALVLEFYNMRRWEVGKAMPNAAHIALADMQKDFDVTIITQNIDDLHERAGSKNVLHLHGEIFKMCSCNDTSTTFDVRDDMVFGATAEDGSLLRPAIVWFEEEVPMISVAAQIMTQADIFMLNGTTHYVHSTLTVKGDDHLHTAMAKTVGLPLGIAAKLILNGSLTLRGVHVPVSAEIYTPVLSELEHHGICFKERTEIIE